MQRLDYAPPALRPRHSFFGIAALVMAFVVVAWHAYIHLTLPDAPHWPRYDWIMHVAYQHRWLPATIGVGLACIGLLETGKKRWSCIAGIEVIAVTYVLLWPPMNFA